MIEEVVRRYQTRGVDVEDTLFHHVDLVFADSAVQSDDLAVDVRDADNILVDQIDRADTRSDERFGDISADAAAVYPKIPLFSSVTS